MSGGYFADDTPPFLLPCFGACFVHIVLVIMLSNWTHIDEETFALQPDPGLSVKASLVTLVAPVRPTPPKKIKKSASQPQKNPLESLVEHLNQPVLADDKKRTDEALADELPLYVEKKETTGQSASEQETAEIREKQEARINQALAYYQRNQALVERNFNTGTAAQRKLFEGLVVRIKIFLDAEGRLTDMRILKSSGNRVFDAEAERAVRRVKRFILPSDPLLVEKYFKEITMEFQLGP